MEFPKKYRPLDIEQRWTKEWEEKRLYAWDPTASRENTFVVDTPPPTVSGSLHVGHLFSYSHQDFVVRYQRMCGKSIYFPIGSLSQVRPCGPVPTLNSSLPGTAPVQEATADK